MTRRRRPRSPLLELPPLQSGSIVPLPPRNGGRRQRPQPDGDGAFDPSAPSPLHAALQELESLLSGVATSSDAESIDPTTGRRATSPNADDERAGTELSERLLDVAAGLASLHPALHDKRLLLRSLLAWEARSEGTSAEGDSRDLLRPEGPIGESVTRRRSEAMGRVWQERMLDLDAAATALGSRPTERRGLAGLRQRSLLLGLRRGRSHVFPAFQFDLSRRAIHPEVGLANQALGAESDPWGVASWWISPNPRLDGKRPMDLVGSDRSEEVVSAARALTEPIG